MLKIILIFLLLSFFAGCAYTSLKYPSGNKDFTGVWEAQNDKDAILKVYPRPRDIYLLQFESKKYKWEGVGYKFGDKLIAVFRYLNINQQGFITFSLENFNKLKYVSRNPDGTVRAVSYYNRR